MTKMYFAKNLPVPDYIAQKAFTEGRGKTKRTFVMFHNEKREIFAYANKLFLNHHEIEDLEVLKTHKIVKSGQHFKHIVTLNHKEVEVFTRSQLYYKTQLQPEHVKLNAETPVFVEQAEEASPDLSDEFQSTINSEIDTFLNDFDTPVAMQHSELTDLMEQLEWEQELQPGEFLQQLNIFADAQQEPSPEPNTDCGAELYVYEDSGSKKRLFVQINQPTEQDENESHKRTRLNSASFFFAPEKSQQDIDLDSYISTLLLP